MTDHKYTNNKDEFDSDKHKNAHKNLSMSKQISQDVKNNNKDNKSYLSERIPDEEE